MGALADLVKVLYEPGAVFERVREKPSFLVPFAGLAAAQVVAAALMLPYTKAATAAQFAQAMQARGGTGPDPSKFLAIGLIVAPITIAIVLVISAALLWVLVSLTGGEAKFGTLLSLSAFVSVTGVLLQFAGLATLMLKGVANVTSPADLQPALGLDLVLPEMGRFATSLLRAINPFSIWGLVLTAIGLQVTHRLSKGSAYTVAIAASLIGALIAASVGVMFGGRQA